MLNPINTGFGSVLITKTQPGADLNFGTRVSYIDFFFAMNADSKTGKNRPRVCRNE